MNKWMKGFNEKLNIIAEVGTTANGSVDSAKKLVDAAKAANCDFIKFQCICPDDFMSDRSVEYRYSNSKGEQVANMYSLLKELEFSPEEWREIFEYSRKLGIEPFATVDWIGGVDLMEELGVELYKISAWDLNYPRLLKKIFETGKPVLIDLGPVDSAEVLKLKELSLQCGNYDYIFMHDYHTHNPVEMNMAAINFLRDITDSGIVGYSSPDQGDITDLLSIGLRVNVIEKRLTFDNSHPGHHHKQSMNPEEFISWCDKMKVAEEMMGKAEVIPSEKDLEERKKYFRSLAVSKEILRGEVLSEDNIKGMRPGTGIDPWLEESILGSTVNRDMKVNTLVKMSDLNSEKL